jgi:LEA14-like dessication related protein
MKRTILHRPAVLLPLLALLALASPGCRSIRKAAFPQPKFALEDVKLSRISLADATLECTLRAENPDEREFTGRNMQMGIYVNDELVGTGRHMDEIRVPGKSTVRFPLSVTATFQDILRTVEVYRVKEVREVPYELRGKIDLYLPIGVVQGSFGDEGKIPVPRLPKLRFEKVEARHISLLRYWIVFTFEAENVNTFGMSVKEFAYDLKIGGESVARGSLTRSWELEPTSKATIELPVETSASKLARALRVSLQERQVAYELTGHAVFHSILGRTEFPIDRKGKIDFARDREEDENKDEGEDDETPEKPEAGGS